MVSRRLSMLPIIFLLATSTGCGKSWQSLQSQAGDFFVEMPGQPVHSVEGVEDPGVTTVVHSYRVQLNNGNTEYSVAFSEYPQDSGILTHPQVVAEQVCDDSLQRMSAQLTSQKDVQIAEGYATQFTGTLMKDGEDHVIRSRVIVVGTTVYQLIVYSVGQAEPEQDVGRFFNSFHTL